MKTDLQRGLDRNQKTIARQISCVLIRKKSLARHLPQRLEPFDRLQDVIKAFLEQC